MKYILNIFLALLFSLPALAQSQKPYLAVYANPQPGFEIYWEREKTDGFIFIADTWDSFPEFLKQAKINARGRKVILNLSTHGGEQGLLYLAYPLFYETPWGERITVHIVKEASMGYIINEINKVFKPGEIQELDIEACFSGYVYSKSIRGNKELKHEGGNVIENCKEYPLFPVYGVPETFGLGNILHLQRHKYNLNINYIDLRETELNPIPQAIVDESEDNSSFNAMKEFLLTSQEFQYWRERFDKKYKLNLIWKHKEGKLFFYPEIK